MKNKKILRGSMFGYKKNDCLNYIKNLDDSLKISEDEKNLLLEKESGYLSEIDKLYAQNADLENKLEEKGDLILELNKKIAELSSVATTNEDEVSSLKNDNEQLKEKVISLISEKDDISIKYNKLYTYYEKNKNEISESIILSKQQGEEIVRNAKIESERIIKDAILKKEQIYREKDEELNNRIFQLEKIISEKNIKKQQIEAEMLRLISDVKNSFRTADFAISQFKVSLSDEIDGVLDKFSKIINKDNEN